MSGGEQWILDFESSTRRGLMMVDHMSPAETWGGYGRKHREQRVQYQKKGGRRQTTGLSAIRSDRPIDSFNVGDSNDYEGLGLYGVGSGLNVK